MQTLEKNTENLSTIYIENFISNHDENFEKLLNEVNWWNRTEAREEYFMSEMKAKYSYGDGPNAREYISESFHPIVFSIMKKINEKFSCDMDVCFLNKYVNFKKHIGYHSDDSFVDHSQPICVVSFGAEREIWWKRKDFKGTIPDNQKQLLKSGSLFIMPPQMQHNWVHRIPKSDKQNIGTRISLTYRRFKPNE